MQYSDILRSRRQTLWIYCHSVVWRTQGLFASLAMLAGASFEPAAQAQLYNPLAPTWYATEMYKIGEFGQKLDFADYDPDPTTLDYSGRDDSVTILSFRVSRSLSLTFVDQVRAQPTTVRIAVGDNIASSFVPEPSTWAMMIAGFGLVGGVLRRRKVLLVDST